MRKIIKMEMPEEIKSPKKKPIYSFGYADKNCRLKSFYLSSHVGICIFIKPDKYQGQGFKCSTVQEAQRKALAFIKGKN